MVKQSVFNTLIHIYSIYLPAVKHVLLIFSESCGTDGPVDPCLIGQSLPVVFGES